MGGGGDYGRRRSPVHHVSTVQYIIEQIEYIPELYLIFD